LGRVKEWIFSLIGQKVIGAIALDLYAGIGSLGIEALSRGASWTLFVERDREAVNAIKLNLARLGLAGEVWQSDVVQALEKIRMEGRRYDIIFADPPYGSLSIFGQKIFPGFPLKDDSLIVIEYSRHDIWPLKEVIPWREKRFGETLVSILRKAS